MLQGWKVVFRFNVVFIALCIAASPTQSQVLAEALPSWAYVTSPADPQTRGTDSCAGCHLPDGAGGPDNARIAGSSAEYIVQQLKEIASGARSSAMPKRPAYVLKQARTKELSEDEMHVAAEYYASLSPRPSVLVKEDASQQTQADQIFEVAKDDAQYIAYVPPGSVAKGKTLTRAPGGNTKLACASCHGADFRGVDMAPSIAGRSPTYVMRQLWDIKTGARNGAEAEDMKPVVEKLSSQDMLSLAAYLATLKP